MDDEQSLRIVVHLLAGLFSSKVVKRIRGHNGRGGLARRGLRQAQAIAQVKGHFLEHDKMKLAGRNGHGRRLGMG